MTKQDLQRFNKSRKLTKKARKETVRAVIDRNHINEHFDGEDVKLFDEMVGADFRHVVVSECGAVWEEFSWNKAIDGWKATSPTIVAKACRYAIMGQIRAFRDSAIQECVKCDRIYDLTVDHANPSFSAILKQFIAENGEIALVDEPNGVGRVIAEATTLSAWQDFHYKHADFQTLCRSCNSEKAHSDG